MASTDDGAIGRRRPTIRDVADRAGVSKSLVSLVMRGEPMVREEKRLRVQRAAEELGYRLNYAARSLSAAGSGSVGVLVADLRNPLLVDVVEQAGQVLEEAGMSMLLTGAVFFFECDVDLIDPHTMGALKDLRVEGILVVGSVPDQPGLARLIDDVPTVVASAGATGLQADEVRNDDHLGMRLVVDFLVARGHRHIAHLGGRGGAVAEDRANGYRQAMHDHGLDELITIAESDFTEDAGYRGTAKLLRGVNPVTAITAINDLAAIGAVSAAIDSGRTLPEDVAITGYDDTFVAAIRQVSLSSVNPDSRSIGATAARCLLERIGDPGRPTQRHLLPPRLVTRGSTATPPRVPHSE